MQFMIYGATGYTGKLLAEEAFRRGLKPVLAGRDAVKLEPLTSRYGAENPLFWTGRSIGG